MGKEGGGTALQKLQQLAKRTYEPEEWQFGHNVTSGLLTVADAPRNAMTYSGQNLMAMTSSNS
jgi:hypothetical protein